MRTSQPNGATLLLASGAALLLGLVAAEIGAQQADFALEGSLGYVRDENFFQVEQAQEVDLAAVELLFDLSYAGRRTDLDIQYSPVFERQLDEPELEDDSHRLTLRLDSQLGRRTAFSADAGLWKSPRAIVGRTDFPQQSVVIERSDQFRALAGMALEVALGRRSALALGLNHSSYLFDEPAFEDSRATAVYLRTSWRGSPARSWYAQGSLRRVSLGVAEEVDIVLATLGADLRLGRGSEADSGVRAGLQLGGYEVEQDTTLGLGKQETGVVGSVELLSGGGPVRWRLQVARDVAPLVGFLGIADLDYGFAGISADLGQRLTAGAYGTHSRQSGFGETGESETTTWNLTLDLLLTPIVALTAEHSRIEQDAEGLPLDNLSYGRTAAYLAVRIYRSGPSTTPVLGRRPRRLRI